MIISLLLPSFDSEVHGAFFIIVVLVAVLVAFFNEVHGALSNAVFSAFFNAVFSVLVKAVAPFITGRYRAELDAQSYIYDRQLNVIIDLYGMLVKLHENMLWTTQLTHLVYKGRDGDEDEKERRKNVADLFAEFDKHYFNNLILLPKTMADQIQCLGEIYYKNYVAYIFAKDTKPEPGEVQEKHDKHEKIHKNIQDMKPNLDQLREDFRRFTGRKK